MAEVPPALMQRLLENAEQLGPAGTFFRRVFGAFDFRGIEPVLPTRTFERELTLSVGDKRVRLLEVGPAHTRGDVLVHSPADRIVFTGDILFVEGTPIVWEGPVANWIRACERIEAMDVDVVVPGHGPITDRDGARRVREYLTFVREAARERFEAGLSAREAAHDIDRATRLAGPGTDRRERRVRLSRAPRWWRAGEPARAVRPDGRAGAALAAATGRAPAPARRGSAA
jgi:glyoxylase-like metal-dependent hydrolase (beta-lactamase superfamily II)